MTGEVVALYHFKEAERIEGPAVVGESVLLQASAPLFDWGGCLPQCARLDGSWYCHENMQAI